MGHFSVYNDIIRPTLPKVNTCIPKEIKDLQVFYESVKNQRLINREKSITYKFTAYEWDDRAQNHTFRMGIRQYPRQGCACGRACGLAGGARLGACESVY